MFVITKLRAEAQLLKIFENDICLRLLSLLLPTLAGIASVDVIFTCA